MIQELTEQEIEQVHGGVGPIGAVVGGVVGAIGAGATAWATGQDAFEVAGAAAIGALTGAFMGGTTGMFGIASLIRGIQITTVTTAGALAGGMAKRTYVKH